MFLLDTNVVSELRKLRSGQANPQVVRWAEDAEPSTLFLSVITVHELEIGVCLAERRDPHQVSILRAWLETQVMPTFANRILPVDTAVARRAARLHVPNPRPINDALIAATAWVHGATLITRNVEDFSGCAIQVFNPWQSV
jgi:predicted nucleic acid-binding protein